MPALFLLTKTLHALGRESPAAQFQCRYERGRLRHPNTREPAKILHRPLPQLSRVILNRLTAQIKDGGGAANNIYTIFNRFTDAQKLAFWTSFGNLSPRGWQYLNNGAGVNNWLKLYNNGIAKASKVDVITNQRRVDAITYYYDAPQIKAILQALSYNSRLLFLDTYGSSISLDTKAEGIQLLINAQNPLTTGFNVFTTEDIQKILSADLSEDHLGFLWKQKSYPGRTPFRDLQRILIPQTLISMDLPRYTMSFRITLT
ncbi:hypothetical protein [Mucilaginibacter aquaedulcis]|uniref:hypothetical protein n=1 Tax=Mucilaginibacter aquaedulcis TaxID=1187081 RepID=UPI0025B2EAF7|nr:hypothetical protein [Mucilaginibacter aquaedulcis]MDN3548798.1 hypothetical protein [Mucilaginibacter aquaedulcis]